jgi:hypothetical protein
MRERKGTLRMSNKRIEHDFVLAAPLRSATNPKRLIQDVRLEI